MFTIDSKWLSYGDDNTSTYYKYEKSFFFYSSDIDTFKVKEMCFNHLIIIKSEDNHDL